MTDEIKQIGGGLVPNPEGTKVYSHTDVFGAIGLVDLPTGDFFVTEPLAIKNQDAKFRSDFCGGYGCAAVKEAQEDVILNPEFTWMAAKKALGGDAWKDWGIALVDIANAACKVGFLEQEHYPFEHRDDVDRDFIANPENWPLWDELAMLASEHRSNSFFEADGPHDTFDNFRSVMWMNRSKRQAILTGVKWRQSWTDAPGGMIEEKDYSDEQGFGHAIAIFGQMDCNGELRLVAQLSNGVEIGDKGLFYFPRGVVNKEFTFGSILFNDMPQDKAKFLAENKLRVDANPLYKLFVVLMNWITRFFIKK